MKISIKLLFFILFLNSQIFANPVKAVLIERLCQFVEWPDLKNSFKIGVYQNNEIIKSMDNLYKDKEIQNLPVSVKNIKNENDSSLSSLDLIYFPQDIPSSFESAIKKINKSPILIISDSPNDVNNLAHISFYFEDKKIKFMVNKDLLEGSHLKASYQLLKLAKIVDKSNQP